MYSGFGMGNVICRPEGGVGCSLAMYRLWPHVSLAITICALAWAKWQSYEVEVCVATVRAKEKSKENLAQI